MDELTMLREAFGPDEVPPPAAWERSRAALLERIEAASPPRRRARLRWPAWVALGAAAAVAGVVGVVAVTTLQPPSPSSATAVELLENAAVAASRKPWVEPRPDQFMFKETRVLTNPRPVLDRDPNGPLVPGAAVPVVTRNWLRVDGQVWGRTVDGELVVERRGAGGAWAQIDYDTLAALTTPEAVLAWEKDPKGTGGTLDSILSQYVLPPAVEAAFFRAIARGEGVRLNPDGVNVDGRPAVALILTVEGHRSHELLFDTQTYELVGERIVAIADHTGESLDGTRHIRKGDLFRQALYTASRVVDDVGETA